MKAAVLEEYGKITWKDVPDPETKADEVLVRIKNASICGSDQHVFKGEFHPRTQTPFIPGHEFAGIVEEAGKDVEKIKRGDLVAIDPIIWCGKCEACKRGHYPACTSLKLIGIDMDGGFAEYISVPENMLFIVNPSVDPKYAALVEVLSIGFHATNRSGVKEDDSIVIWGAGKVGQSILQAVRLYSRNQIFMVDILDNRLKRAKMAYPDIEIINSLKTDPVDYIHSKTMGKGVDIAFEAVGHPAKVKNEIHPIRSCIRSIRGGGIICVLGLADEPVPVIMKELIWKEAKIVTSRVSHGEFSECIENLEKGKLKPEALITAEMHASKAHEAFEMLEKDPENQLKIILDL
ncbi:MAG: zinc-dependent alcohol dehydrogenase [Bacteroidales bacterium]